MAVLFPYGSQVSLDAVRWAMGMYDAPTGPSRYEAGDLGRLANLAGIGYALSNWWNVNIYSYVRMDQGEGYIYDGCYGRDSWCYYDATSDTGEYVSPWGGPSTYNTERGYNNGTFLTFGYGYCQTYVRPYTNHNFVSYSSAPYNCRAFYDYISRSGYGWVAFNGYAYAGGDQYASYSFQSSFQAYDYLYCALVLWY